MLRNKRDRLVKTMVLHAGLPEKYHQGRIWYYQSHTYPWRIWGLGFVTFETMIGHIKRCP